MYSDLIARQSQDVPCQIENSVIFFIAPVQHRRTIKHVKAMLRRMCFEKKKLPSWAPNQKGAYVRFPWLGQHGLDFDGFADLGTDF